MNNKEKFLELLRSANRDEVEDLLDRQCCMVNYHEQTNKRNIKKILKNNG